MSDFIALNLKYTSKSDRVFVNSATITHIRAEAGGGTSIYFSVDDCIVVTQGLGHVGNLLNIVTD